jgi:hypothetical protein
MSARPPSHRPTIPDRDRTVALSNERADVGTSPLCFGGRFLAFSLGSSALICGAILTLASLLFFFFLRVQLRNPPFR